MAYFKCGSGGNVVEIDGVAYDGDLKLKKSKGNIKLPDIPYKFYMGCAELFDGQIHIIGSFDSDSRRYHYKFNGSTWTSVSTLPLAFYSGSSVVYNGNIHIFLKTYHYKWNGSSWSSVSTLPYNFYDGSAVVYNGNIHILGSGDSKTYHYKWNGSSWSSVSTLPYNFYDGSAVVYNRNIHILGSGDSKTYHYKWNGSSWRSVSTLPYNFYDGSAVVYNGNIHILGSGHREGTSFTHYYSPNHYILDGTNWVKGDILPYNFHDGSAVVADNAIYLLGSDLSQSTGTSYYEYYFAYKIEAPIYEIEE